MDINTNNKINKINKIIIIEIPCLSPNGALITPSLNNSFKSFRPVANLTIRDIAALALVAAEFGLLLSAIIFGRKKSENFEIEKLDLLIDGFAIKDLKKAYG